MRSDGVTRTAAILAVAVPVVLGVAAAGWFQSRVPIQRARPHVELSGAIDFGKLFASITAENISQIHRRIVRPR